jgi:hypothetical protein
MRNRTIQWISLALTLLLLWAAFPAGVDAQAGDGYDLSWSTIDGGGAESRGGEYVVIGTAGQPDAGALTGGDYTVAGGFWNGAAAGVHHIYLPLVLRNPS